MTELPQATWNKLAQRAADLRQQRDEALKVTQDWIVATKAAHAELRAIRARVEAAVSTWPPGPRKGDVLRAIGEGK